MDVEPYAKFQTPAVNADWIRAGTGNQELTGSEYRISGQDGTGGLAAFRVVRPDAPLLEQPVVFFGSEGAVGVVVCDFADYLCLLAGGLGLMEALEYGPEARSANGEFTNFAEAHAPTAVDRFRILGYIEDGSSLAALKPFTDPGHLDVRREVASALEDVGGEEVAQILSRMPRDE